MLKRGSQNVVKRLEGTPQESYISIFCDEGSDRIAGLTFLTSLQIQACAHDMKWLIARQLTSTLYNASIPPRSKDRLTLVL